MVPEPNERGPLEPNDPPYPDFEQVFSALPNAEPLAALDLALLELEKRLYRYAHVGPELLQMADEGLVLAVRSKEDWSRPSRPPSTPRATCRWWGWETGSRRAPAPPGIPARV